MKYVITGATGFLGNALSDTILTECYLCGMAKKTLWSGFSCECYSCLGRNGRI